MTLFSSSCFINRLDGEFPTHIKQRSSRIINFLLLRVSVPVQLNRRVRWQTARDRPFCSFVVYLLELLCEYVSALSEKGYSLLFGIALVAALALL